MSEQHNPNPTSAKHHTPPADYALVVAGSRHIAITVDDDKTAIAGKAGLAIAGCKGRAVAGDKAQAIAGVLGVASVGDYGTALTAFQGQSIAADYGIASTGRQGTAQAGEKGQIHISYWDDKAERNRTKVGYIGEDGLKPNTLYRLNYEYEFEEVKAISMPEEK